MLGLRLCARAPPSCGERGPLFIAVRRPLTVAASPVAEHRLHTRRLSNCGSRVQLLCGMWDLPRPGLEPVSPALAGRFSTTAPPGKPVHFFVGLLFFNIIFVGFSYVDTSSRNLVIFIHVYSRNIAKMYNMDIPQYFCSSLMDICLVSSVWLFLILLF